MAHLGCCCSQVKNVDKQSMKPFFRIYLFYPSVIWCLIRDGKIVGKVTWAQSSVRSYQVLINLTVLFIRYVFGVSLMNRCAWVSFHISPIFPCNIQRELMSECNQHMTTRMLVITTQMDLDIARPFLFCYKEIKIEKHFTKSIFMSVSFVQMAHNHSSEVINSSAK